MGVRRAGNEGWRAQNFALFAAGVSHDSPRAQTCTFHGPGASKTPQFHERTPRERRKNENCGGESEKKSEILGGPAEGCPAEGCPAEGCLAEGCPVEGCPAEGGSPEGGPAEGSIGNGVRSSGFWVQFKFLGTKTETEQKQNEERDE